MSNLKRVIMVASTTITVLLGVLFLSVFSQFSSVHAAQTIPYKINFQGRLTDNNGNIVADGLYNIRFTIYDASSGGTNLWQETRQTGTRVQITNGLFDVRFGDVTALSPDLFDEDTQLYLQVELPSPATATCSGGGCASYTEGPLSPRQPIAASPYAFNADKIDGLDGSQLARVDQGNTFTGDQIVTGELSATSLLQNGNDVCDDSNNCSYATSTQFANAILQGGNTFGATMTIGTNDNQALAFETNGTTAMTILQNGNVGIGTTNPLEKLHVSGGNIFLDHTRGIRGGTSATVYNGIELYNGSTGHMTLNTQSSSKDFLFVTGTSSQTELVRIMGTGNVGIGTASPDDKLDIEGSAVGLRVTDTNGYNFTVKTDGAGGRLNIARSGANVLQVDSSANVNIVSGALQTAGTTRLTSAGVLQNVTNANAGTFFTGGTLGVDRGGTGAATHTAGGVLFGNGTSALQNSGVLTNGQLLIGDGSGAPTVGTLTAGTGISVTNGAGSITLAVNSSVCTTSGNCAGVGGTGDILQGGNTFGAAMTIGTNDAQPLNFETSGTTAMTILANGNVGIGTASPGNKLHVYQSGTGYQTLAKIENPGNPGAGSTRFEVSNSESAFFLQAYGSGAPGALASAASIYASDGSKLLIGAGAGMPVQFFSNDNYATPAFTLSSGGSVGIGTTSPGQKLDVQGGNINTSGEIMTGGTSRLTNAGLLQNVTNANAGTFFTGGTLAVNRGGTGAATLTAGGILFGNGTSAVTASSVLTNGQLLIGDGSGTPTVGTLTGANGIGITNGAGSITVGIQGDSIGNAQLEYDTGQHLTVSSSPTFAGLTVNGSSTLDGNLSYGSNLLIGNGDVKTYQNLASNVNSSHDGAIVINTTYPWNDNCMFSSTVDIYYYGSAATYSVTFGGYMYTNDNVLNSGYESTSNKKNQIRFARNSATNTLAFVIGSEADSNYINARVSEFKMGSACSKNDAHADGWTIAEVPDLLAAGYDFIQTVNDKTTVTASSVQAGTFTGNFTYSGTATFNDQVNIGSSSVIDFAETVGNKELYYSNQFGRGVESSTLTDWSSARYRIRIGGTSVSTGTEKLTVTATGIKFGGGDATQALDITGNGLFSGTVTATSFQGSGASLTALNGSNITTGIIDEARLDTDVALKNATSNFTGTLQQSGNNVCHAGNNCSYAAATGGSGYIQNGTSLQTANFNISGSGYVGGNLGVGTTSPGEKLHVEGNLYLTPDYHDGTYGRAIKIGYDGDPDIHHSIQSTISGGAASANGLRFYVHGGGFADNQVLAMSLLGSGNVGIGTTSAAEKLTVAGNGSFTGTVTASAFQGSGASLTSLDASNISSGTLAVAQGGTGANTAAGARTNLGVISITGGDTMTGLHRYTGHSTSWGSTPSSGLRVDMGTSSGATWLLHGYSGANFRGGIQMLDSGATTRFYNNANFAELTNGVWNANAIPTIDILTKTSGTLSVARGGTGATSLTSGGVLFGGGTGAITASSVLTNGQLLIGDGTGAPTVGTLTAGTGISVTNGAGSITVAAASTVTLQGNTFNGASQLVQLNASSQLPAVSGALLTNLDATDLTGVVASARLSGSYTGITGTGALTAGSIASGFGNINIGANTFTGNGSGLSTLNGANISTGTVTATQLASNSVDSAEIVAASVDESHLNATNTATSGAILQYGGSNNFTWIDPATLGGAADLQEAYEGGSTIQLAAASGDLQITNDSSVEMLFLEESTGNIGIGTATPTAKLDIAGTGIETIAYGDFDTATWQDSFTPQSTLSTAFKSDGTVMYVLPAFSGTEITQYTLSTPWDVSTASSDDDFDVITQSSSPADITFKPDGTVMYVTDFGANTVYQYNLGTAWDIGTAVYDDDFFITIASTAIDITFKPDGTRMYVTDYSNLDVDQYTLSTPWDVNTASYASKTKSVASQDSSPAAAQFSSDGTAMYVLGSSNSTIYKYTLSTPWDVNTASYSSDSLSVSTAATPFDMVFLPNESDIFVVGNDEAIHLYQVDVGLEYGPLVNIDGTVAVSGLANFTGGLNVSGWVGIGTSTPGVNLHIQGASDGNVLRLQDTDGTCNYNPEAGTVTVSCSSDEKLKDNIQDSGSALAILNQYDIKDYTVKASGNTVTGVIAQDVQKILPGTVHDNDGTLEVELPNTWELVRAIQELDDKIDKVTLGSNKFDGRLSAVESELASSITLLTNTKADKADVAAVDSKVSSLNKRIDTIEKSGDNSALKKQLDQLKAQMKAMQNASSAQNSQSPQNPNGLVFSGNTASLQSEDGGVASLQVSGSLFATKLEVAEDARFAGTIFIDKNAVFNRDAVGEAIIESGDTEIAVEFKEEYEYQPIITATPRDWIDGTYRVTNKHNKGFTIEINQEQTTDVGFDWHSFASNKAKIQFSTSPAEDVDLTVKQEDGTLSSL